MSTGSQPYASPTPGSFGPAPPKQGKSMGCILGVVALVLVGGGLVCCGGPIAFFGWAGNFFLNIASAEIKKHPVVIEHLGEVTSCNVNLQATGELGQDNHFVFDVTGTKGSGVVTIHIDAQGNSVRIISGDIKLPSGEKIDLVPGGPAGGPPGMPPPPGF